MSCGKAARCLFCRFVITNGLKVQRNYVPQHRQILPSIQKPFYGLGRPISVSSQLRSEQDDSVEGNKSSKVSLPGQKKQQKVKKENKMDEDSSSSESESSSSDSDSEKSAKQVSKSSVMKSLLRGPSSKQMGDRRVNKFARQSPSDTAKTKEYREGFLRFQADRFTDRRRDRPSGDRFNKQFTDRPVKQRQTRELSDENAPPLAEILEGKDNFGLFTEADYKNAKEPIRTLFDTVAQEEYDEAYKQSPFSALEEHLQWTREGKLWHFPIDNEQGWEEEKQCSFQDHVFFNEQLKDFPKKGPVRHFMELVTTALAKNHHLSVKEKHETIKWYKDYFMQHEDVLIEKYGEEGAVKQEQKHV